MNDDNPRHHILITTAACGLFVALGMPAPSAATVPGAVERAPSPMAAQVCGESTVYIEIDTATDTIYYLDPSSENLVELEGDLEVAFGSLGHVVLDIEYSSSEWNVIVEPDDDPPVTYTTTNGGLRYSMSTDIEEYEFTSSEVSSVSTMTTMVPTIPNFKIRPRKSCDE